MEKDRLILENIAYFAEIVCTTANKADGKFGEITTVNQAHLFDLEQWLIAYKEWNINNNSTKILG